MNDVISGIRADLKESADEAIRASSQRYFKEEVKTYGMKTATAHGIAKKHWQEVKQLDKKAGFAICEELFASGYLEESFIASEWLPKLSSQYEPGDLAVFRTWIERYIDNWAKCDTFCNHTLGEFLDRFPQGVEELKTWTKSQNRWMRRAAAVSLIIPAKRGEFLQDIFEIADMLLLDQDDLVQKGYGWMLKEASRKHQEEVYQYVLRNRREMPRTALRYAIELMPKELRAEAMKRDW